MQTPLAPCHVQALGSRLRRAPRRVPGWTTPARWTGPAMTFERLNPMTGEVASRAAAMKAGDIPAIAEAGIAGFSAVSWTGVSAPAITPPEDSRKAACLGHRSDPFPGRTRQAGRKRTGDRCNFIKGLHGLCRRRSGPVGQGCEGFQHYGGLRLRALGAWRQLVNTSLLLD